MLPNIKLEIEAVEGKENIKVAKFIGDLDTTNVNGILDELVGILNEENIDCVIGDMENLRYVNSTGIGVLLHFNKVAKDKDGVFILANMNDNVYEIMNIIGATSVMKIYDTVEEVLENFGK